MRRFPCLLAHAAWAAQAALLVAADAGAQVGPEAGPTSAPTATAVAGAPEAAAPGERLVTLADVERAAVAAHPQVRVARAQTHVAEAQAEQARSPLLPQLAASASYTRQTGNFVTRPGVASPASTSSSSLTRSFDYWNFGVSGTQLLYDFGQTPGRASAAATTVDAQRIAERTTRVQILAAVRRAYFAARATKELVLVARGTLDDQNRHLTQVKAFVEVGTQPPIALAQQRASVANAQVQYIGAENNYETAKAQLNQAAGIPTGTDYTVGDEELGPLDDEDQPLDALVARALAGRPELATLTKQREAQEETLRAARGGYGPTLSAAAGANETGTALDSMVPNWNAGLVLAWAFFQGGLTTGQLHQAAAGLESVDAQRNLEELQVRLDVDSARLAMHAAKATIGAAEEALASAREQLRLAEQRYATGVGSIIELTDAQLAYTSAAAQVVQARYGLSSARAQLLAALGRT